MPRCRLLPAARHRPSMSATVPYSSRRVDLRVAAHCRAWSGPPSFRHLSYLTALAPLNQLSASAGCVAFESAGLPIIPSQPPPPAPSLAPLPRSGLLQPNPTINRSSSNLTPHTMSVSLLDHLDLSRRSLWIAVGSILFNPIYWNILARSGGGAVLAMKSSYGWMTGTSRGEES